MGSEFESWFSRLATKPLPGGVAAAAVAASMGSALVAKVCQLTLAQSALSDEEHGMVEAVRALAERQGMVMMGLAGEDERAYQAVLDASRQSESSLDRRQAWQRATETPLHLVEVCQDLLERLPALFGVGIPVATVDLKAGCWLLEVGLRTGMEAVESNLDRWPDEAAGRSFRARARKLRDGLRKRSWCGE